MAKFNWAAATYQTNVIGNASTPNSSVAMGNTGGISNVTSMVPFFNTVNTGLGTGNVSTLLVSANLTYAGNALTIGSGNNKVISSALTGSVSATGNISGNYIFGNGAFLTGISGGGSSYGNSNVAIYLASGNVVTDILTTGLVSATGNVYSGGLNVNGDAFITGNANIQGNLTYNNLTNITTANLVLGLGNNQVGINVTGGGMVVGNTNEAALLYNFTSKSWDSNLNIAVAGNVTATGNIQGTYVLGNGSQLTGLPATYANANVLALGEAGWAGNIIPVGNSVYSLGSLANQWKDLFISNATIYLNGVPLGTNTANGTPTLIFNDAPIVTSGPNAAPITTTISTTANVVGSTLIGNTVTTVYLSAQGNIAAGGSLSVQGNVIADNLSVVGTINLGAISVAGTVVGGDVSTAGNVSSGNVSATGTISSGNVSTAGTVTTVTVTATGTVSAGNVDTAGDVSAAGTIIGATVSATGTVSAGNVTATGNIIASGTIAGADVSASGNVQAGNVVTSGTVSATGSITTNTTVIAQGNIRGGNLVSNGSISSTGDILTSGNVSAADNVTGAYFIGDGSQLTGLPASYGNANVAAYLPTYAGNLSNVLNITASNTITATTFIGNIQGNIIGNLVVPGSTGWALYNDNGNAGADVGFQYTVSSQQLSVTGNIVSNAFVFGNAAYMTGIPASYGNANVANYLPTDSTIISIQGNASNTNSNVSALSNAVASLTGNVYGNANVADYLPTYNGTVGATDVNFGATLGNVAPGGANDKITLYDFANPAQVNYAIGVESNNVWLAVDNASGGFKFYGNTTVAARIGGDGNISAAGNIQGSYIIGDGSQLTNLPAGDYSNANVAAYLPTDSTIIAINSNVSNTNSNVANLSTSVTGIATDLGNLSTSVTGIATDLGNTNSNVANLSTSVTGIASDLGNTNSNVSNLSTSVTGIASDLGNTNSNVSNLSTSVTGIASDLGNTNANVTTLQGQVTSLTGNVYGNANVASYLPTYSGLTAATLTTNAQPNITSVGTLSSLSVTGDITGGSLSVTGNVTTDGALTVSGDTLLQGNLSVQGNVTFINSNVITTNDKYVILANNQSTSAGVNGAGIVAGNPTVASMLYNDATASWQTNLTVTPLANNAVDLGAPAHLWSTLYANTVTAAAVSADTVSGTLTTADQPNVTSVGTLANLSVSGNIYASAFWGDGYNLSNINASNIINTYSNTNVASYLANGNDPTIVAIQGNAANTNSNVANLTRAFLLTKDERFTVYFLISVGSGIGPSTVASKRSAVSMICFMDASRILLS